MNTKIYLSADIEGTCGIAHWEETEKGSVGYDALARQMTREVAAACEGALAGGADSIFIKDAHDSGRNLLPDLLPEKTELFRAWGRDPYSMMSEIDESYAGVMFTGYHSAAGTDANPLAHTMNRQNTYVTINDAFASEMLINSYTAAMFGVPVLLVTGDKALCETMNALNGRVYTVATLRGVGNGAVSIHPQEAVRRINAAAKEAVQAAKEDPKAFRIPLPKTFEVKTRYREHYLARRSGFYPGAVQKDAYTVQYTCTDWMDALRFLMFTL